MGRVVGNGLQAQKNNPEIKVRSIDPILVAARDKLEQFNQVRLIATVPSSLKSDCKYDH